MSEQVGKMLECDRCSKTVFLLRTGEFIGDGGRTRTDTYEPAPDGWLNETRPGDLCPACAKEYVDLIEEFMLEVEK